MKVIETYTQAIATIDPFLCTSSHNRRYCDIWIEFAKFYEEYHEDTEEGLKNVREIYTKATKSASFRNVDDLATIYCEWAEMELRHKKYDECRQVMRDATTLPSDEKLKLNRKKMETQLTVQERLHQSKKIWAFMADIEVLSIFFFFFFEK
ncbi:spliceosome complex protein [Reticulomyxa filosa]|uniref:Spliceosome complex protein n=1 Tax=Reticulomyxa filosa TaxID=46433 RepID=X6LS12_RETFI|nr:spliceosome complex protein [Reticulomyxa filosa]|eukprot:ETO04191.1 spliceosome complex protein [Reticulomyxa filosa]